MAGSALSIIDEGVGGSVAAAVERRSLDAVAQEVDAGFAPGADDVGEVTLKR